MFCRRLKRAVVRVLAVIISGLLNTSPNVALCSGSKLGKLTVANFKSSSLWRHLLWVNEGQGIGLDMHKKFQGAAGSKYHSC